MKVLKNYRKNVFSSVPFKKVQTIQSTHLQPYGKLSPPQVFVFFIWRIFEIAGRASVVESLLGKVTKTYAFCDSAEKPSTCTVSSEKYSILSLSGTPGKWDFH